MAANPNYSDILATTIESRTRKLADNVTNNNAILKRLSMKGKIKTFSGGNKILQELSYAENPNAGWYSGYDLLPVGTADVISAAEYPIRQAAVPVVISGLEQLQNAGREQMIDLMESRLEVAEATLANLISRGLYSDGTGFGNKEIIGLNAAMPTSFAAGTYGGIANTEAWWQSQYVDGSGGVQSAMNEAWSATVRGTDRIDLWMADNVAWKAYIASLQSQQRFNSPEVGDLGFASLKYMDADVVLDGGIGDLIGNLVSGTMFGLNCDYLHYRPHAQRNMVPLSPNRRYSTNQDAEVQIIGWAGNLTTSGRKFQARIHSIT